MSVLYVDIDLWSAESQLTYLTSDGQSLLKWLAWTGKESGLKWQYTKIFISNNGIHHEFKEDGSMSDLILRRSVSAMHLSWQLRKEKEDLLFSWSNLDSTLHGTVFICTYLLFIMNSKEKNRYIIREFINKLVSLSRKNRVTFRHKFNVSVI